MAFTEAHKKKIGLALLGNKNSVGRIASQETRLKLSEKSKGRKHSDETKLKMRLSKIGNTYSLGKKKLSDEMKELIGKLAKERNTGKKHSEETRLKMRISHLGKKYKPMSEKGKANIGKSQKGKKPSLVTIEKRRGNLPKGRDNHFWRGGVTKLHMDERRYASSTFIYKNWRRRVLDRDNYMCVWCGSTNRRILQTDHIKPWCLYPELRYEISNGRTLCSPCHKKTDTYGVKACRTIAQTV
jgi:hypothetical protein